MELENDGAYITGDEMFQIRLPQVLRSSVYEDYEVFADLHCAYIEKIGRTTFLQMWRKRFGFVKCSRPNGTFAMCDVCSNFTAQMKLASDTASYEKLKKARYLLPILRVTKIEWLRWLTLRSLCR